MESTPILIPLENVAKLTAAFERLARRAAKLGVPAPTITFGERQTVKVESGPTGFEHPTWEYDAVEVTVTGDAPQFDGWTAAAVIDLDPEDGDAGHVVHVIGERETDLTWKHETDRCDHCSQAPRGRKTLIVVEHESGERKIVGSTCVRDFLGSKSPAAIAAWFELLGTLDDLVESFSDGSQYVERRYEPVDFLAWTYSVIAKNGWVSRTLAREDWTKYATADTVVDLLHDLERGSRKDRDLAREYTPTEEQLAKAELAVEWARDLDDPTNDYLANVHAVAHKSGWRRKDVGIGASIATAYDREVAKVAAAKVDYGASVHVGEIGERLTIEADVLSAYTFEGYYGPSTYVRFVSDGNVFVWKASGVPAAETGDHVWVTGTVKEHAEGKTRDGSFTWAETKLTRCKLTDGAPKTKPRKRKAKPVPAPEPVEADEDVQLLDVEYCDYCERDGHTFRS